MEKSGPKLADNGTKRGIIRAATRYGDALFILDDHCYFYCYVMFKFLRLSPPPHLPCFSFNYIELEGDIERQATKIAFRDQ